MKKINAVIAVAVLSGTLLLTGCTSEPESEPTGTTLLDVKRLVQLERNGFTGQISAEITQSISDVGDESYGCADGQEMRSWRSTALTELVPSSSSKVSTIVKGLVGIYVAAGWDSTAEQWSDTVTEYTLESETSPAIIRVTSTEAGSGTGATIAVTVTGACVLTDGPGSDELAALGE